MLRSALGAYARLPDIQRVLFVGVRLYTRRCRSAFGHHAYMTIDRSPWMRVFGAPDHVVGSIESYRSDVPYDLVILNGVIGWGIDNVASCEAALESCARLLRPGGHLLIGVNEERASTPDVTATRAIGRFGAEEIPALGASRVVVPSPFEGSHTFLGYRRNE